MSGVEEQIIVQKFGGSSVATVDHIRAVARRVLSSAGEGKRVVVVVSAMGKRTDELLTFAKEVAREPSRRELDMLLSTGERVSGAALAMAIEDLGGRAISFTGSQCGIITSGSHSKARIREVRPHRIMAELEKGKIVVVAGFQGVSEEKEVTTLARGGSDATAVAIASALGAAVCEIYSDVDGIYDGDPRSLEAVRRIERIDYDFAEEVAEFGAKVIDAHAVTLARAGNVSVKCADARGIGGATVIGSYSDSRAMVSQLNGAFWLKDIPMERVGGVLSELDRESMSPLWCSVSDNQMSMILRAENPSERKALERIGELYGCEDGYSVLSVSRPEMSDIRFFKAPLQELFSSSGIVIHDCQLTAHRLSFLVDDESCDRFAKSLHSLYCG